MPTFLFAKPINGCFAKMVPILQIVDLADLFVDTLKSKKIPPSFKMRFALQRREMVLRSVQRCQLHRQHQRIDQGRGGSRHRSGEGLKNCHLMASSECAPYPISSTFDGPSIFAAMPLNHTSSNMLFSIYLQVGNTSSMRKILWMIVLLGVYIWLVTSGNDRIVLETGKSIYQSVVNWFDDAEIDYQLNGAK